MLKTPRMAGVNGEGTLGLVRITGQVVNKRLLRLWLVNETPSVAPSGELLANAKRGGNAAHRTVRDGARSIQHRAHQKPSRTHRSLPPTTSPRDKHGEVLPGTTTAVHDAKSGRLFLSGMCEVGLL